MRDSSQRIFLKLRPRGHKDRGPTRFLKILCEESLDYKIDDRVFSVGDLSQGSHLFPFRTEKLSLVEPMIVFLAKVGSRQHRVLDFLSQ